MQPGGMTFCLRNEQSELQSINIRVRFLKRLHIIVSESQGRGLARAIRLEMLDQAD